MKQLIIVSDSESAEIAIFTDTFYVVAEVKEKGTWFPGTLSEVTREVLERC